MSSNHPVDLTFSYKIPTGKCSQVGFEILTAVTMKRTVFWAVLSCSQLMF
jgi:hypothetical protein